MKKTVFLTLCLLAIGSLGLSPFFTGTPGKTSQIHPAQSDLGDLVDDNQPASITVRGVEFPGSRMVGDSKCHLTGAGTRRKYLLPVYNAALYVDVNAGLVRSHLHDLDHAMLISIKIESSLITPARLADAVDEGFAWCRNSPDDFCEELHTLRTSLPESLNPGDQIDVVWGGDSNTELLFNGERCCCIPGLPFKRALFGVWLSDDPVDSRLRDSLIARE